MAANGQPACILYVQTFGDLVTFNPTIHALVADGVFLPSSTFRLLTPLRRRRFVMPLVSEESDD